MNSVPGAVYVRNLVGDELDDEQGAGEAEHDGMGQYL
jgi:hypothetical protein